MNFCPLFLVPRVDKRSLSPPQHATAHEAAARSPPGRRWAGADVGRATGHQSWSRNTPLWLGRNFRDEKEEEDGGMKWCQNIPPEDE